ncbi:MAG: serine hydrolase [Gemmatimonadetes bacterium]|nr:serine hydrolase [Gemmatimonadota bacterium]
MSQSRHPSLAGWSIVLGLCTASPSLAQTPTLPQRGYAAAIGAHHICAGVFVVGRDYQRSPETVLAQDVIPFPHFLWQSDFEYTVYQSTGLVTVRGQGIQARSARYTGDQGCSILPRGATDVSFMPVDVPTVLADAETVAWPMGDLNARARRLPPVSQAALDVALDRGASAPGQNTRAIVVVHKGKIIGERYAPGFTRNTPQISWSMGKSITAALVGVLVRQGHFTVNDVAPVAEWRVAGDPRNTITVAHLLRMSSGLDFTNFGLTGPDSYSLGNEHFVIYFDALNVFEHAVNQPLSIRPNSQWRYRNSDPLTLGRIIRETVEGRGESYHEFPQRHLFDRIGARNFVLETDAYGNFIMTGYDFGSARDWARFGLLHLQEGMWEGEHILPSGWIDFITTPAPADRSLGYGGLWWLNRGGALDQVPPDAYWAAGHMGQLTMVIPSREMVIVRLGPSAGGFNAYFNNLVGEILEALGVEVAR